MTGLCLLAIAALASANGANDISKSVATLVGSGVTDYRRAPQVAYSRPFLAVVAAN